MTHSAINEIVSIVFAGKNPQAEISFGELIEAVKTIKKDSEHYQTIRASACMPPSSYAIQKEEAGHIPPKTIEKEFRKLDQATYDLMAKQIREQELKISYLEGSAKKDLSFPALIELAYKEIDKLGRIGADLINRCVQCPNESLAAHSDLDSCVDEAWGIIANASGGNWALQNQDWQAAARRWEGKYMPLTSKRNAERVKQEPQLTEPSIGTQPDEQETTFQSQLNEVLCELFNMLVEKNRAYGDSALNPINVFSDGNPEVLLRSRIDDKITRIKNLGAGDAEDAEQDLMGYLILLRIYKNKKENELLKQHREVEVVAKAIYEDMPYDGSSGPVKPKWVEGGNSDKQEEARKLAIMKLRK